MKEYKKKNTGWIVVQFQLLLENESQSKKKKEEESKLHSRNKVKDLYDKRIYEFNYNLLNINKCNSFL